MSHIDTNETISISGITSEDVFSLGSITLTVHAISSSYSSSFHVVGNDFSLPFDGIIGLDFLNTFEAKLDFENWVAYLTDEFDVRHRLTLFKDTDTDDNIFRCKTTRILNVLRPNFPKNASIQLEDLCTEFIDIFGTGEDSVTTNNFYTHKIYLTDKTPVYIKNYRSAYSDKTEIERQVRKMLNDNIIEPTVSNYNNPILLVPKKALPGSEQKKWRLVTDFRQLNKKMIANRYPMPRIDEILDRMGDAKYFSVLDLLSGFHQIELAKESRKYTAFSCDLGSFQYTRLPFGVMDAPNSFQHMMNQAFTGLSPNRNFIYIDDYCLTSSSEKEMLTNLRQVFQRCRDKKLTLNAEKCKFFATEVTYLGHKCTNMGILPDESKFEAILNYPRPNNADDVRRFVAMTNYYRRFIENFAHMALHLTNLTRKNVPFTWTKECEQAFQYLKTRLTHPSILRYPDFEKEFVLFTDASGFACGAVLSQEHQGTYLPVAYASKAFNHAERKKPIIELELLAIHWGIKHFRQYLYGRRFLVKSDHKPLIYLFNMVNPTSKLTRIRLDLTEYDFDIEYLKGSENVTADALSRIDIRDFEQVCQTEYPKIYRVTTRKQSKKDKQNEVLVNDVPIVNQMIFDTTRATKLPHMRMKSSKLIIEDLSKCAKHTKNDKLEVDLKKYFVRGKLQVNALLPDLEKVGGKFSMVEIERNDELFKHCSINEFKTIGNSLLKTLRIAILPAKIEITDPLEKTRIITQYHNDTLRGGHSGVKRTIEKIRTYYNWKNMSKMIHNYIKDCDLCQRNKILRHNKQRLCKTETPLAAFDVVQMDLQGPFLSSFNSNKYILTIVCELTKFLVATPIRDKEAKTVANSIFDNFIKYFGPMKRIVSDLGTEFKNQIVSELNNLMHIQHDFSTAYHHETLGVVERNHKTFNEYLRAYLNEERTDWDSYLNAFVFCYNRTPSTATGYSPYELVFGKLPPNLEFLNGSLDPVYNYEDYVCELKHRLQYAYKKARELIERHKLKRKLKYDENTNEVVFELGEHVLLREDANHKHQELYSGPYVIVDVNEFNCVLQSPDRTSRKLEVNKNRLKKYKTTVRSLKIFKVFKRDDV